MAYIIAHGTVNGYQKIQVTSNACGSELQVLTDIRAEFDNTATMLSKPVGYILQMSPSGVWVSVVKTLMDGERSGNGAGFFAFSAFISQNEVVSGDSLKEQLDKLMQHYIGLCPNFMTKNIGVDWSFVTNASAALNAICQLRRKAINTNYTPSNNFAYVPVTTEEQISQLLDKPFQPEYGAYKAVFIGTHLQHPMRLTQQTCLNIELENEVFDIVWSGNTQGWNNLPKTVRKNEIVTGSYTFTRKYYHPYPVKYSDGTINKADATLTLKVPALLPEIHQITLRYNYPEAVERVMALAQSHTIYAKTIPNVLEFSGDEFATQFKIHLFLKDGYRCDDIVLTPCDCPNNICYITTITKMQLISLQILEHNENQTKKFKDNVRINKSGRSFYPSFNETTSSLCLSIPENEDFNKEYSVSLINGTYYSLNGLSEIQKGFYIIYIQRKQNSQIINTEPVLQKRPVYLDCKIIDQIKVYYNEQHYEITNNNLVEIPVAGTRDNISVKLGNKNLKFKKIGDDKIKIYSPLFSCLRNGNTRLIFIGAVILLLVSILIILQFTNTIDITKRCVPKAETIQVGGGGKEHTPPTGSDGTITEDECLYNELNSILKIQRREWCFEEIDSLLGIYDDTNVIASNHCAYELYKELVWMKCRKSFDGYWYNSNQKKWILYNKHKVYKNGKLSSGWIFDIKKYGLNEESKTYAYLEIYNFLSSIVKADDIKQKEFFEQYVKNKKVEKMTFPEVKQLWNDFKVSSPSTSGSGATNTSNNRSSSNTETSSNQSNPPAEENAENY